MDKYPLLRWRLGLRGFWDRLVPWADGSWARSRSPLFPQCRPQLVPLEDRWLPSSGIVEYTVPTSNSSPLNMTLGPDGNVWFTENGGFPGKIAKITTSGTITEYSLNSGHFSPFDIAAGPDGNLWFTEQTASVGKSTTGGSITDYSLGGSSSGSSYISSSPGPNGTLWLTFPHPTTDEILKVTTSGSVTTYNVPTANAGVKDITLGPDGNMWFTEGTANKVGRVTPSGSFTEWSVGSGPAQITLGPDGNLWFTETGANKIGRITSDGNGLLSEWSVPTSSSIPSGIVWGPDNNVWFVEYATDKVGRVTLNGTFTEWSLTMGSAPNDIVVGADNNLWFTESGTNKIGTLAWTLAANVRSDDPVDAISTAYGPSSVSPQTGNARLTIPLDYEQSTMPFG
jgi:streptogramin lyase